MEKWIMSFRIHLISLPWVVLMVEFASKPLHLVVGSSLSSYEVFRRLPNIAEVLLIWWIHSVKSIVFCTYLSYFTMYTSRGVIENGSWREVLSNTFDVFRSCISTAASERYRVLKTTGILSKCRVNVCWILIAKLPIISSLVQNVYLPVYTFKLSIWCSKCLSNLSNLRQEFVKQCTSLTPLPPHLCHPASWQTMTFSFYLINSPFRDPTVFYTYIHDFILPRIYRVAQKLLSSRGKRKKKRNKVTLLLHMTK